MKTKKYKIRLYFIVALTCICLQLCFLENSASADMTVTSFDPPDNAINVPLGTNLTIIFNMPWKNLPISNTFTIRKSSDGTAVEYFGSGNYTGEGTDTLIIDPWSLFEPNTGYYINIENNSLGSDPTGSPVLDGISNSTTWNFTTGAAAPDCYPPDAMVCCATPEEAIIKHLSPPDNAHFMQSYEGLSITFNGNTTVATGNILIREYVGDAIVATIDVTSNLVTGWGTPTITIDPSINLANNTHYYINFPIDDYEDIADKDSWDFWTKSTPNTFAGSGL